MAENGGFLRIERRPGGYALVVLCREPVNTMNLAAWCQLTQTLDELEADPQVGVVEM
jgi:3,2-trans-enoyl-CoA isomerase